MPKYTPLCNNVLKVSNLRELADAVDSLLAGKSVISEQLSVSDYTDY